MSNAFVTSNNSRKYDELIGGYEEATVIALWYFPSKLSYLFRRTPIVSTCKYNFYQLVLKEILPAAIILNQRVQIYCRKDRRYHLFGQHQS